MLFLRETITCLVCSKELASSTKFIALRFSFLFKCKDPFSSPSSPYIDSSCNARQYTTGNTEKHYGHRYNMIESNIVSTYARADFGELIPQDIM